MKPIMLKTLLPEQIKVSLREEDEVSPEVEDLGDEMKKMLDSELSGLKSIASSALKSAETQVKGKSEEEAEKIIASNAPELTKVVEEGKRRLREGKKERVNELLDPLTIASIALALPKILEWIGKLAKKLAQKFGKEGNVGAAIEHFAHKWHKFYIKLVRAALDAYLFRMPPFNKLDENSRNKIAEIFFMIIVASMGIASGAGAIDALGNSQLFVGGFEGLLTAVKGGEVASWLYNAITPMLTKAV